jgi:hypothetical protein
LKTNPRGGGGDQFVHLYTKRQGDYGSHCTDAGKIVYRRPRHYWTPADISRIVPKVAQKQEEQNAGFDWFWTLINYLSDYMLEKIVGLVGLSDDAASLFWSWIMRNWIKLCNKIWGSSGYTENLFRAYDQRLQAALARYLRGDSSLLKALEKDLLGVK